MHNLLQQKRHHPLISILLAGMVISAALITFPVKAEIIKFHCTGMNNGADATFGDKDFVVDTQKKTVDLTYHASISDDEIRWNNLDNKHKSSNNIIEIRTGKVIVRTLNGDLLEEGYCQKY
jgi:hypothetical protein